jgi:hypothetical protein
MRSIGRGVARRQSSPCTGKLSARPAGKPGYSLALENLRRSLPATVPLQRTIPGAPDRRFGGMAESIGPMWFRKPTPGPDPATSRQQVPIPGKRTRREDHALLIVRDEFRPVIPRRVGRHQSPSPLHRHTQPNTRFSKPSTKGDISLPKIAFILAGEA